MVEKKSRPFALTSPCDNCPFRKDVQPYLREERVRELDRALVQATFDCHKTTFATGGEYGDEDGVYKRSGREVHCAGALIMLEKMGRPSQMMRIAGRLGIYDPDALRTDVPVYDSFDEMAKAQPDYKQRHNTGRKAR